MVLVRTPANQRIIVNWNVQAFADACAGSTGVTNFGTYMGHSPSAERATDVFTAIPKPRSVQVPGDAVAEFALRPAIWKKYGVRYIIWRQRINWNNGDGWQLMEDRGNDTENHFDHAHVSFNVIPKGGLTTPEIPLGGNMLIVNVKSNGIFLLRGDKTQLLTHPDHVLEWVKAGVPYQDKVEISPVVFQQYGVDRSAARRGSERSGDVEEASVPYDDMVAAVQTGLQEIYDEYVRELQVQ